MSSAAWGFRPDACWQLSASPRRGPSPDRLEHRR